MLARRFLIGLVAVLAVLLGSTQVHADPDKVVVLSNSLAPLPSSEGTGLCAAAAVSSDPGGDFEYLPSGYLTKVNLFIETHKPDRLERTIPFPLDQSNHQPGSHGDHVFPVPPPGCQTYGCPFLLDAEAFAERYRGYFAVPPGLVNQPVHFGFYSADAVSLTLFGKYGNTQAVLSPCLDVGMCMIGQSAWRQTHTVIFEEPGLYGVEILYLKVGDNPAATLEMLYLVGDFDDFEAPVDQGPRLTEHGFQPIEPVQFYQTLTGAPSFPDLSTCKQCARRPWNVPYEDSTCDPGYYCNDAALCAPCTVDDFCGSGCSPCGDDESCTAEGDSYKCVSIIATGGTGGACTDPLYSAKCTEPNGACACSCPASDRQDASSLAVIGLLALVVRRRRAGLSRRR